MTYTQLTPGLAWAWSWRARAAVAIGEVDEARVCARRAIAAQGEDGGECDAEELLAEIEG